MTIFLNKKLIGICSQYGFAPNIVYESNNINSIIRLVRNGLEVSIAPSSLEKSHQYPELTFLKLKSLFSTDVLLATPKKEKSPITNSVVSSLLK